MPCETAARTTSMSRAEVTAMTSARCPAVRIARTTSRPCMSGRNMSSSTRSIPDDGLPSCRIAAAPSCALPRTAKPRTRST